MKQLRFTTTEPHSLMGGFTDEPKNLVDEKGVVTGPTTPLRGSSAYIDGTAERLAKFDIPRFISGDIDQLEAPEEDQDIMMVLPAGEFTCVSKFLPKQNYYVLRLKPIYKHHSEDVELLMRADILGELCDVYEDDENIVARKSSKKDDYVTIRKDAHINNDPFWKEVYDILFAYELAIRNA